MVRVLCFQTSGVLSLLALWASPYVLVAIAEEVSGKCDIDRDTHFSIDERASADEVSALQTTFEVSDGLGHVNTEGVAMHSNLSSKVHSNQSSASPILYHSDAVAAKPKLPSFKKEHEKEQKKDVDLAIKMQELDVGYALLKAEDAGVRSSIEASSSPTFFLGWPVEMAIAFVVVCLLLFIVMVHELMIGEFEGEYSNMTPKETQQGRKLMKLTEACRVTMASCDYTFIIPLSLQLSLELGWGTIASGFMVGSFALGTTLGSVFSMKMGIKISDRVKRRLLILSLTLVAVSECALSCAMYIPSLQQSQVLTLTIILVRVIGGFAVGWGSVSFFMVSTINSPEEQNWLETCLPIADFFGLALGFALTALCTRGGNYDSKPFEQCAPVFMLIAGGNAFVALIFSVVSPMHLEPFSYRYDEATPERPTSTVKITPDILAANPRDVLSQQNRGALAITTFFQVVASSLCTTGVEVGTSYMMQVDAGWGPTWVALGQFTVFIIAMVIIMILAWLRWHLGTAYDMTVLVPASIVAILATVFYFPHVSKDMLKYHLFIGDSFVYPILTVMTGVIASYAVWAANKDRWNYRENIVLTIQVADGLTKFGGAPLVRGLIMDQGRTSYSIMQLVLTIFSMVNFLWARNVEMYIEKADLEEVIPDGRGFFGDIKQKATSVLDPFRDPKDRQSL